MQLRKFNMFLVLSSILCSFMFLFSIGFSLNANNLMFLKGDVFFRVNSTYHAGDTIHLKITVSNGEPYIINNGKVVVDLVYGCAKPTYPSQFSDCDDVFLEKIISGIKLAPYSSKVITVDIPLYKDLRSGTYRIDVYFLTDKATFQGIPFIFLSQRYASFKVIGNGDFPFLKILRTKTYFVNSTFKGPVGAPVKPNSLVHGMVYVKDIDGEPHNDLTLKITVCPWDDTTESCLKSPTEVKTTTFSINANEVKGIPVTLTAPSKPDAYAVRLEVFQNNRLVSLYRSRLIVEGDTGKIRNLLINCAYLSKDNKCTIVGLIGASPDHYTKPVFSDGVLSITVKDLNTGKIEFSKSYNVPSLSLKNGNPFYVFEASFLPKIDSNYFEVCGVLRSSKTGEVYDKYCFTIKSKDYLTNQHKYKLIRYQFGPNNLDIYLCVYDAKLNIPSTSKATIFLLGNGLAFEKENLTINGCSKITFSNVKKGNYQLVINDLEDLRQTKINITGINNVNAPKHVKYQNNANYNANKTTSKNQDRLAIIIFIVVCLILLSFVIQRLRKEN